MAGGLRAGTGSAPLGDPAEPLDHVPHQEDGRGAIDAEVGGNDPGQAGHGRLRQEGAKGMERVTGIVLLGFGARLALERL